MAGGQIEGHRFIAEDGRVWDWDAMTRTDPDGSVHPESEWSDVERAAVEQWRRVATRNDTLELVRQEIEWLQWASQQFMDDKLPTDNLRVALTDGRNAAATRAATIRNTANPTLAQLKEEAAQACERDVALANALINILTWRSEATDHMVAKLATDLGWLAKLTVPGALDA
jgi:hypothetical protein